MMPFIRSTAANLLNNDVKVAIYGTHAEDAVARGWSSKLASISCRDYSNALQRKSLDEAMEKARGNPELEKRLKN